ncbi:hypothetical protein [Nocardiopsis metallicus]|uniref:DUF4352 domain-containing protein n=1 Tax=Nocardiopsis metallicus TaxID=179819 RepID=A0A840WQE4_9ACTN|nr:hypothetical protein [Nocardiopsis metallicus]MBB5493926.1 hypothetical protein [Nocardiopsis metallicus]
MKGWILIRCFVFSFVAGTLSLLLMGGIAIYAFHPGPEDERGETGAGTLRFGDFFDYRTDSMGQGEAVSYTVTSVRMRDTREGQSHAFEFTLGIVNNTDRHVEGQYPDVYCENEDESHLVLNREMARGGDYPAGMEPEAGTLGMTIELTCEFSGSIHPEELVIALERENGRATFVDPMSVVDRMKWRHTFDE